MSFLSKLKELIFGPDYDKELRDLNDRIFELNADRKKAEAKLEHLKNTSISVPNFQLRTNSEKSKGDINPFIPYRMRPIRTMKDLMERRKEEEAQRKRQITQQVVRNFDSIRNLIDKEKPDEAEDLLFSTSSAIRELGDEGLSSLYQELQSDISNIRSILRQREIQRREEEERRRAAEEAARLERERQKKQREEEIRLEKERQAREYNERLIKEEQARQVEIERLTGIVEKKKDNDSEILRYLEMKGIRRFYHFTDRENLKLIRKYGGLYSWYYCQQNGINIPNAGGDSDSRRLDRQHDLEDYVRLSFCNDHPMAYRKHKEGSVLALLYVDVKVASFKETLFSDRNAASSSFSCGGDMNALQKVNIMATQRNYVARNEGEIFALHQAECMIKTFLPIKYITNINNPEIMTFG